MKMANVMILMTQKQTRTLAMNFRMLMVGFLPIVFGVTSATAADPDLAEGEKLYDRALALDPDPHPDGILVAVGR